MDLPLPDSSQRRRRQPGSVAACARHSPVRLATAHRRAVPRRPHRLHQLDRSDRPLSEAHAAICCADGMAAATLIGTDKHVGIAARSPAFEIEAIEDETDAWRPCHTSPSGCACTRGCSGERGGMPARSPAHDALATGPTSCSSISCSAEGRSGGREVLTAAQKLVGSLRQLKPLEAVAALPRCGA